MGGWKNDWYFDTHLKTVPLAMPQFDSQVMQEIYLCRWVLLWKRRESTMLWKALFFFFPQNELMPPTLPPRDCKQRCSCPVLLFNKHFVEFSKLFNICSEMFASSFRSCVTELPCRQLSILESSLAVPLLSVGQTGSLQLFCGFHRIQMTDLMVTEQIVQF